MIATLAFLLLAATVSPGAALERLALSGNAQPQAVAQALQAGLADLKGETGPQRCKNAFLAGELYRQAAAAVPGQGYEQQALEAFRAMRVDHMNLPTGELGYIGEARVHLQNGDPEQALAVLAPLLNSPGVTRIKRLAEIESLEALMIIEPGHAISQARQFGEPAHWFLARALAKQGEREKALELARSGSVVASAPNYQRLQLIADLDALNDSERSAWAQALVQVGRKDHALAVLREHAPAESARLYAILLQSAGDPQAAAGQWRRAIDYADDPQDQLAYADCLASIAAGDPLRKPSALNAYRQLIESNADDQLRRRALRRWIHLNGADGFANMLTAHQDLVGTDPYLRYARVVVLQGDTDPQSLTPELKNIASETQDPALRAAAILLHARISAEPREALALLDTHWEALLAQPTLAESARARRVGLWLELGMIDRAVEQSLTDPNANPPALLQVAQALADRYDDGITNHTRENVLRLTSAAISAAPEDESTAFAAAKLLLRVGARADAIRILSSLNIDEAKPTLAEALLATDRPQDAIDALADVDTPEASLQRGLSLLALNQTDQALVEIRHARKASRAGSDFWWDATLALTAVQIEMDNRQAAEQVLRVAEALYPVNARLHLRTKLQAIKKGLQ